MAAVLKVVLISNRTNRNKLPPGHRWFDQTFIYSSGASTTTPRRACSQGNTCFQATTASGRLTLFSSNPSKRTERRQKPKCRIRRRPTTTTEFDLTMTKLENEALTRDNGHCWPSWMNHEEPDTRILHNSGRAMRHETTTTTETCAKRGRKASLSIPLLFMVSMNVGLVS
jgi:hypothetical protein